MKGLLERNETLQIEALEGLLTASGVLGLDTSRYEKALKKLGVVPMKKRETAVVAEREESSFSSRSSGSVNGKYRRVKSAKVEDGYFVVRFSGRSDEKDLRRFVLKKKRKVLYVFDIARTRLPYSIKRIRGGGFREIRIAQYDPTKIRIVVEVPKAYDIETVMEKDTLKISLPSATKRSSASTESRKPRKGKRSADPSVNLSGSTLRRYTVVIDPGHGGKDAGAVGYQKRLEKDAVLAVAKRLKRVLRKRGFNVYLTRERDVFIPLKKRTRFANRKQADFFVSIHANAAAKRRSYLRNKGIETYFLSPAKTGRAKRVAAIENRAEIENIDRYTKDAVLSMLNREKIVESNKLAIDLQKQMLTSVRRKYKDVVDNGVRKGPFWVLVGAQMPAVLIEIGYITHPTEARRLFNPYYQKLLAEGIANGIESYIYHKTGGY